MRVFISWSGEQSRQIAIALRNWLPKVIQPTKPYMSERDNEAGTLWEQVIASELEESSFGVVCLTPSNLDSRWLHFEAGAISKAVGESRVVPLLYHLGTRDVGLPLSRFQMKPLDRQGVWETLESMNSRLDADHRLEINTLAGVFNALWPKLDEELQKVPTGEAAKQRSQDDLLEEILGLVRTLIPTLQSAERAYIDAVAKYEEALRGVNRREAANAARALDELRFIAGPNGMLRAGGGNTITLTSPRLNSLSELEEIRLDEIETILRRGGTTLIREPIAAPPESEPG